MSQAKLHLIKKISGELRKKLASHRSILVLGPCPVRAPELKKTLTSLKPSAVVFVDGGLIHKKKFSVYKQLLLISMGDGDSTKEVPDYLFPREKDQSDLMLTLSCLKKTDVENLALLGFGGARDSRPDHLLFNIGEVNRFVESRGLPVKMDNFLFLPAGKHYFTTRNLFSVFSLKKTKIRLSGRVKYALKEWTTLLPLSSLGLSNHGSGKILLENQNVVGLYFPGEKIS